MKALLFATVLSLSANVFAVETKDCPNLIKVSFSKTEALSLSQVYDKATFVFAGEEREQFDFYKNTIKKDLKEISGLDKKELSLKLHAKKNGKCDYSDGVNAGVIKGKGLGHFIIYIHGGSIGLTITDLAVDNLLFAKTDLRPIKTSYGEISDGGRAGDLFYALLGFTDVNVTVK